MKNITEIEIPENYVIKVNSKPLSGSPDLFLLTMGIKIENLIREPETEEYCKCFKVSKNKPEAIKKLIEMVFMYGATMEFIKDEEVY
ncbi:MAG: hypothetical protein K1X55_13150 [Chitinophagales bacterium]|nr:hypothetical protein [Chitinophagales bacterium]